MSLEGGKGEEGEEGEKGRVEGKEEGEEGKLCNHMSILGEGEENVERGRRL